MAKQKVIIRVDGNSNIGLGHIYRGIALGEMLKNEFDLSFFTKTTSTTSPINDAGFKYDFIPTNIELLGEPLYFYKTLPKNTIIVLDGYGFSENYQQKIKEFNFKLVYIDDLAIGTQKADLVINHSPGIKITDYKTELYTKLALGLDYALIRQSFINNDRSNVKSNNNITNILVSFGGADPKDYTYKTVVELLKIEKIEQITVLIGAAYTHTALKEIKSKKIRIYNNLAEKQVFDIMLNSDLAIVPASTISIELASIGIPLLLGYFADNQKIIYQGFLEKKAMYPLGNLNIKDFTELYDDINKFANNKGNYYQKFKLNPNKEILKLFNILQISIREVTVNDIDFVYNLSNESFVRENSYNSDKISFQSHKKWFSNQLFINKIAFFILEYNKQAFGQVRFAFKEEYSVIGIAISSKFRGMGLATQSLILAVNIYFQTNKLPIYAYIKKINIASIKSFEKAGFKQFKEEIVNGFDSFVLLKEKNENR